MLANQPSSPGETREIWDQYPNGAQQVGARESERKREKCPRERVREREGEREEVRYIGAHARSNLHACTHHACTQTTRPFSRDRARACTHTHTATTHTHTHMRTHTHIHTQTQPPPLYQARTHRSSSPKRSPSPNMYSGAQLFFSLCPCQ